VKQHDFPIILVLLDGQPAPGLPFLRQLHWVITADPASEKSLARIMDAATGGGAPPGELWRHTAPYRGLYAMTESDADFFFGRGRETVEVIRALAAAPDKLPLLLGNSGVGKSSLAQAGAIAALMRQAWPETAETPSAWPPAFNTSRRWCFLKLKPGTEPVRALVEPFLWTWQLDAIDPRRAELQSSWVGESSLIDCSRSFGCPFMILFMTMLSVSVQSLHIPQSATNAARWASSVKMPVRRVQRCTTSSTAATILLRQQSSAAAISAGIGCRLCATRYGRLSSMLKSSSQGSMSFPECRVKWLLNTCPQQSLSVVAVIVIHCSPRMLPMSALGLGFTLFGLLQK
jgi:hypothetical protein